MAVTVTVAAADPRLGVRRRWRRRGRSHKRLSFAIMPIAAAFARGNRVAPSENAADLLD